MAGACVKIEKFAFRDGGLGSDDAGDGSGSDSGAFAQMVGDHIEVAIPGFYRMVFAAGGYHFPSELHIGNAQVFGSVPATCSTEHGVGVGYVPAAIFNSTDTSGLTRQTATIKIDLPGPGVARVTLDWSGTFSHASPCVAATPSGRSVFTFFPDGRIQRMDAASIDIDASASDCQCPSDGDTSWLINTFYSFKEEYVSQLVGIPSLPSGDGMNQLVTGDTVCINPPAQDFQIAAAWRAGLTPRHVRRLNASSSYALIADMEKPGMTSGVGLIGDTSTTLVIGTSTDCSAMQARAAPFANDVQIDLALDGGAVIAGGFGLGQDGLYGGETSQGGGFGYEPMGNSIKISPRAPSTTVPPFGIWLDLHTRPNIQSVTQMPANIPARYTVQEFLDSQNLPTGRFVFFFPDGLATGNSGDREARP